MLHFIFLHNILPLTPANRNRKERFMYDKITITAVEFSCSSRNQREICVLILLHDGLKIKEKLVEAENLVRY